MPRLYVLVALASLHTRGISQAKFQIVCLGTPEGSMLYRIDALTVYQFQHKRPDIWYDLQGRTPPPSNHNGSPFVAA